MTFSSSRCRAAVLTATFVSLLCLSSCGGESDADPVEDVDEGAVIDQTTASSSTTTDPEPDPTTEAPTTEAPTTSSAPELALEGFGPYEVGVSTLTIDDGDRGRPLRVDVWFPLSEALEQPQQYTFLPGVYYESPKAFEATPSDIAEGGPFPLIVYSHGSSGLRYIHSNYTETLASHGYVVAAPDHTGNTSIDLIADAQDSVAEIAFNRPNDIAAVIDGLLDGGDEDAGAFTGSIDGDRIGVTGHSFGGFTSYAVAAGYDNELGVFEPDNRVDAIVTLAPAASVELLSDERLSSIDVPTMVIGATDDKRTPIEPNVTRPWELLSSEVSYRIDLIDAEHQTFTDVCAYVDFLPTLSAVPEVVTTTIEGFAEEAGCDPDDMPIDRAHALTNTFAVTFFDQVLKDGDPVDAAAAAALDDVNFFSR